MMLRIEHGMEWNGIVWTDARCKQVEQKNISQKRIYIIYRNEFDRCEGNAFILLFLLYSTTKRNDTFYFGMWMPYVRVCMCVIERVLLCAKYEYGMLHRKTLALAAAAAAITSRSSDSVTHIENTQSCCAVLCEVIRECRQSAHVFLFSQSVSRV